MANSSTQVCSQSLIRLMYCLSCPAHRELTFVTNVALMVAGRQQRDVKFILQGVVGTTLCDETEASIKSTSHAHLWQCTQIFRNHIHMWSSRRCRWERSYKNLFVTNVNLLPGVEGATGPGWQLVVSTGIITQALSSGQTQGMPWHCIMRRTKRQHFLKKQWPGGHREPDHHF